jgi:hypothetical protein
MAHAALATYLADHLAGSTAGVELARRVARNSDGGPRGQTLSQLVREIEADRETLKELMAELDVRGSRVKNGLAWVMERTSRLKPNGRLRGDGSMQRLHDLEALSLGIAGKGALWVALRATPEIASRTQIDLDELDARARDQRERVERERIEAARVALVPSPASRRPQHDKRPAPRNAP